MEIDVLLQYLFDQSGLSSPVLARWIQSSEPFRVFVERYKGKIRRKIVDAFKDPYPAEKFKDVRFELKIAYLMLKSGSFSVEYERYGRKGPDFTVTDKTGVVFNVEVKRIRAENTPQMRFDIWKSYLRSQVCAFPSRLALYMKFGDELDASLDFVERLEDRTPEIIDFIAKTVSAAESAMLVGEKQVFWASVPGFEDEFVLRFREPPYPTDTLVDDGGENPPFRTGEEYRKFDELYWKVLAGQTIPDMINVLAINTDSKTHDSWALKMCMHYLNELAERNDIARTRRLSGVLFRGAWALPGAEPNELWEDTKADCPIPGDISLILRRME